MMEKEKRLTKKDKFAMLKEFVKDNEMLTEFIDNELKLLDKKSSSKSMSKIQKDNVNIKENIVKALESVDKATITQLMTMDGLDYSNQKLSALVKQLIEENIVVRIPDKKTTYFALATKENV